MKLKLKKDIVFFDLETTGVNVVTDRIIQIGMIKYFADGSEKIEKCRLVNPEMHIPKEASDINGITDDMVKNEPTFKKIAKGLLDLIGDADVGGYNSNNFDIPLLVEEFNRVGLKLDMSDRKTVDVFKVFQKMEARTLKAAYKFYCGKNLENAHNALVDIQATIEILDAQVKKYKDVNYEDNTGEITEKPIKNDVDSLHKFTNDENKIDFAGKIVYNEDKVPVFNFGKHKGSPVKDNPSFCQWMIGKDFSSDTLEIVRLILEGKIK